MSNFNINKNDKGRGLYTTQEYKSGDVVLHLVGNYLSYPTQTSIQIGRGIWSRHLESWEGGHVNHHCNPNTKVRTKGSEQNSSTWESSLTAITDISIGEEVTFDYETTEENIEHPFYCKCHGKLIEGWNVFDRVYIK